MKGDKIVTRNQRQQESACKSNIMIIMNKSTAITYN